MKDFFISYNKADGDLAVWIDQQLRDAGYTTTIQAADMPPGSAFVHEMDKAVEENEGLIAVLSPDYLKSSYCKSEWQAFYPKDPNGEKRALIPIRVRECQPKGLLAQRVYIDLAGKNGAEAGRILLDGINAARQKLELPARYPVDDLLSEYLDQLRRKVSMVRIFGDDKPHELDQVFVELTLNEEYDHRPNQADYLGLMDTELRRMRSVFGDANHYRDRVGADDFDNRGIAKTKRTINPDELLRRHTHAVVTGSPGCGKTTLLRYLAWQTLKEFGVPPSDGSIRSQNKPPSGGTPNCRLPVFLELKQLTSADFRHAQSQLEHLLFNKAIASTIKPGEADYDALKDRFLALLREGRVAIFLDGLDEVSGASFFKDLQRAVTDFLHSVYRTNTAIISTRPFALRQFGNAKVMEIQPLNPRQIEQFIQDNYHDVPERQQFQRELQRRRELREVARVPALLGFILQLWRRRGSVTDDKLELYEQITLELARHLDTDKEGVQPDRKWLVEDQDGSLKLDLLRQLAFNQLFKGLISPPYNIGDTDNDAHRLIFTSEQLRDEAASFARTLKEREGLTIDPRNLSEDVKATALLRQVGADHYAFVHLTLQEYLAAWQLAKRDNGDTCERIFCRAYFNPTLAEMEVLPMTLGLVDEPDKHYEALRRLPESLDFKRLRVQMRGLAYATGISLRAQGKLIERIIKQLTTPWAGDWAYWEMIIQSLSAPCAKYLPALTKRVAVLLHSQSSGVRWIATAALGKFGGEQAIEALLIALRDKHSGVVAKAAETLGEIGGSKVVGRLIETLDSEENTIAQMKIAEALGRIGGEQAELALIGILQSENNFARRKASEALGRIGSKRAKEALIELLREADKAKRMDAVFGCAEMSVDQLPVKELSDLSQDKDGFFEPRVAYLLWKAGVNEGQVNLFKALQGDNQVARRVAVDLIGEVLDRNVCQQIMGFLQDSDSWIRVKVAIMLTKAGISKGEETLIEALSDPDTSIRIWSIEALGSAPTERGLKALLKALEDKNSSVRLQAASILAEVNREEAMKILLEAVSEEDDYGRGLAISALGRFDSGLAVNVLLDGLMDRNSNICEKAAEALRQQSEKALRVGLLKALDSEKKLVRRKVVEAFGYYSGVEQFDVLRTLAWSDPAYEVKYEAEKALHGFERKLQYFDIFIPRTANDHSQPSSPPLLTAQERAELETRIFTKYQEMPRCSGARQKGKALEDLLVSVFASIPGFTVSERNYHTTTEEIDLVVRNASSDPFWRRWGNLILVEAKHWRAQRVGKNEYVQFYRKMENRGGHCLLGFLICTECFAETFEKEMLRDSKFPLRVAPIDGEDLQRLVEARDRSEVLRGFVERALLT